MARQGQEGWPSSALVALLHVGCEHAGLASMGGGTGVLPTYVGMEVTAIWHGRPRREGDGVRGKG